MTVQTAAVRFGQLSNCCSALISAGVSKQPTCRLGVHRGKELLLEKIIVRVQSINFVNTIEIQQRILYRKKKTKLSPKCEIVFVYPEYQEKYKQIGFPRQRQL